VLIRVNGQPEELDVGGRRQSSVGGTSRISQEAYVRFCERLGVQLPGPTRRSAGWPVPLCLCRFSWSGERI